MKLIRDGLADQAIWSWFTDGHRFVRPVKNTGEHVDLLRRKLIEECGELVVAGDYPAIVEEAADVLAVLRAVVAVHGGGWADVEMQEVAKRQARGGFEQGTVWDV